mgnify:CR=1 FL=1
MELAIPLLFFLSFFVNFRAAFKLLIDWKGMRTTRRFVREAYARQLVLVRPDGHVAWRADVLPDDPLALIDCVRGAACP